MCCLVALTAKCADKADESADVPTLLKRLADDDFETRKAAREALVGMGKKVVPQLKQAREETRDAEVAMAIDTVLKRIEGFRAEVAASTLYVLTSAGGIAILDGSPTEKRYRGVTFQWKQTTGPDLQLRPELLARAKVGLRIKVADVYTFELTALEGALKSVPALVKVFAADTQEDLDRIRQEEEQKEARERAKAAK